MCTAVNGGAESRPGMRKSGIVTADIHCDTKTEDKEERRAKTGGSQRLDEPALNDKEITR